MQKRLLIDCKVEDKQGTKKFAENAMQHFKNSDTILLYGDLGSGKTYLTKLFGKILGINQEVTSPSFSIINQYQGERCINHLDFYRLKNSSELANLGLDDIFNSSCINFVEWPQICENLISWDHFRIYINFITDNPKGRTIQLIQMVN